MRCVRTARALITVMVLLGGTSATAEVKSAGPRELVVEVSAEADAQPARVWAALTEIGRWWSPDHTFSGEPANLSLEVRAGGCFCESLTGGGSVRHLTVVYVDPGKVLRLEGPLGPLQSGAVSGMMTFTLVATAKGTRIQLDYVAAGFHPAGALDAWAPAVDAVLLEQLARLARHAGTGSPEPPPPTQAP